MCGDDKELGALPATQDRAGAPGGAEPAAQSQAEPLIPSAFEEMECCTCDERFGLLADTIRVLRRTHQDFYCPHGHSMAYVKNEPPEPDETELERDLKRARKELAETKRRLAAQKKWPSPVWLLFWSVSLAWAVALTAQAMSARQGENSRSEVEGEAPQSGLSASEGIAQPLPQPLSEG